MPKHGDIREDGKIFWGYNKMMDTMEHITNKR